MHPHDERRPGAGAASRSTGQGDRRERTPGVRRGPAPAALFDPDADAVRERPWTDALHRLGDAPATAGQRDALDAVASGWRQDAVWALEQLAKRGEPFDAEDLRAYVGDPLGPSCNAMGALFRLAAAAGLIVAVGYRTATRPEAHGRLLRVWKGAAS